MTGDTNGEYRGKSVEAAISTGLAALRLSRDQVEIEVVRPGSRGVLGIGAEDAVVRMRPVSAGRPEPRSEPRSEPKPEPRSEPRPEPRATFRAEPRQEALTEPAPQRAETDTETRVLPAFAGDDKSVAAAQKGKELLAGVLDRMGVRAQIEVVQQSPAETDEDTPGWVLNIVGEDLGILIGRQSESLTALEFVVRLMANQQSHTRTTFSLDVNGYRAKRADSLRKLALRMAEQVVQSGRTMALEPMPPAERRIVHIALRDHPSVTTQSTGEEGRRKVTVIPKRD